VVCPLLLILALGAAGPPRADTRPSGDDDTQLLSARPSHYDFPGVKSVTLNGQTMTPQAALEANTRAFAAILRASPTQSSPIPGSVRIVVPDYDRLRPLAAQTNKAEGAIEYFAELQRLDKHFVADAVIRTHLFRSGYVEEQNDTVAPDPAGADYVLWYQVRSTGPNTGGPWVGMWLLRRAGSATATRVGSDPGTAPGAPRLRSLLQSVRFAALNPGAAPPAAGAGHGPARGGSGIVVDAQGDTLTNNHVAGGCTGLRVIDTDGDSTPAKLVATDAVNDLAVLRTERRWSSWARFRDGQALQAGQPVVVTGFPLVGLLSPEMAVNTGSVTTLAGPRGDSREFQFSAPIQPGNSGGPVLDDNGRVIGVATAMLNGLAVAAVTGALPQNVNFAISADTARDFLQARRIPLEAAPARPPMTAVAVGELARKFTVRIECSK
jgi:S1-C subfamily serine protease